VFPVTSEDNILVCGTNWLGDSIMSMPAIHAFKRANPLVPVMMLIKPNLINLWRMQPDVDAVIELREGLAGTGIEAAAGEAALASQCAYK